MNLQNREHLLNELRKSSNALEECGLLLSGMLWKGDMERSDFVAAGLADAIVAYAEKLGDQLDYVSRYIVPIQHPEAVEQQNGIED